MAKSKPRGSTMSSNRKTTGKNPKEHSPGGRAPRAHRADTPEAKMQRRGMPKTHPTRTPGVRKDK